MKQLLITTFLFITIAGMAQRTVDKHPTFITASGGIGYNYQAKIITVDISTGVRFRLWATQLYFGIDQTITANGHTPKLHAVDFGININPWPESESESNTWSLQPFISLGYLHIGSEAYYRFKSDAEFTGYDINFKDHATLGGGLIYFMPSTFSISLKQYGKPSFKKDDFNSITTLTLSVYLSPKHKIDR